ncbi:conjugal transfer protein TraD [Shewanella frigidimarina]|uniref:conjugal transfer protein TraD n=1 Tax=Shewanella frigidimarina TaxID=56812 RepID=UPI003D79F4F1
MINMHDVNNTINEKIIDASIPGYQAEIGADEAEIMGAFLEDALSEGEALDSAIDGGDKDE